jgi:hypothetical protein
LVGGQVALGQLQGRLGRGDQLVLGRGLALDLRPLLAQPARLFGLLVGAGGKQPPLALGQRPPLRQVARLATGGEAWVRKLEVRRERNAGDLGFEPLPLEHARHPLLAQRLRAGGHALVGQGDERLALHDPIAVLHVDGGDDATLGVQHRLAIAR